MRRLISALCAGVLALSMIAPAAAQGQDTTGLSARHGSHFRVARDHNRHWRGHDRRLYRSHDRRGFYSHGGYGWYNGHRGYRHYRHGYREYNGWWFPAAILGGAIIGNAIVNAPRGGSAHVQWCYDRYRSYRASDNTYQPYNGPRRQCVSPY
jgi:hypothetical protein